MKEISLTDLLEAGCHFGHQTTRWNPKMSRFIYTSRDGIHIFDLAKTKKGLEEACDFVKKTVAEGGQIIFVGTKRQSQEIIKTTAQTLNMPFIVNRWIGGLLTNWEQVSKRMKHLRELKAGMESGEFKDRTKKERLFISREIAKLEKNFSGLVDLQQIPAAIFVADAKKDDSALKEAARREVKTIAILDTNADPDLVDYPIPANDDAAKSIALIIEAITKSVEEGLKERKGILEKKAKEEEKVRKQEAKKEEKK